MLRRWYTRPIPGGTNSFAEDTANTNTTQCLRQHVHDAAEQFKELVKRTRGLLDLDGDALIFSVTIIGSQI